MGYDGNARDERYDPTDLLTEDELRSPASAAGGLLRLTLGNAEARTNDDASRALAGFAREHDNAVNRDVLVGMLLLIAAMPEYQLC